MTVERPSRRRQKTRTRCQKIYRRGIERRLPDYDGAKTVKAPGEDFQTVQKILPDRRGTCKKLSDSLQRCQDWAPAGESHKVSQTVKHLQGL
ncbi:hypothetical protein DPMN_099524 [Dreissena polymorpha]|uniref:Uncharacterized protein n=1 Tax=Dreissena polymorpha TaxID=45954 RepID=A0A9D4LFN8_DREPO|nr:hypothetical protein DPMN_099524 [Dreissena polymorpha]